MDLRNFILGCIVLYCTTTSGQIVPGQPPVPGGGGTGGGTGGGATGSTCAQAGRQAVATCFASNGGFQMQNVVAVLSNGTQAPMPQNADKVRSGICKSQAAIISCVFTNINNYRDSTQCPSSPKFIRLEQETVSLVTGMQQMCGNGPLPPPSTCMRDLNANMKECYTKVGLNPDLFTPTGSQLQGAVIGDNKEMAKKFCQVKTKLFDCMSGVMSACPGSPEMLAMNGYDHEALKKGIEVLCHDVNVYSKGLMCFQTPTPRVQSCVDSMVRRVTDLRAKQVQRTINEAQFYNQFCSIRIQYMDCDLSAWGEQCEKAAVGLKNEFECNLLPSRCKNDKDLQNSLQETCAVAKFLRDERSSASHVLPISGLFMALLSLAVGLFL